MADTIDNLIIDVSVSADKAVQNLTRLQNAIKPLSNASQNAAGGMQTMADAAKDAGTETQKAGEQSGKAQKNIRGVGKDAENAGKAAKKGAVGLGSFWDSLKRIAFYRFVRSIIKGITDAFKTGITNMYHWSKEVQGADRTFSKSMDRMATSALYLKNSLGAMTAPLINSLAPVLDVIIDKVVEVINFFNMLISAISGADTYTVAKKAATEWDKAANKTSKAAKELRRTLLGFDEINRLNGNTTSSSSGGKDKTNYEDMFTTKPLEGIFKKISDITKGWPDWLKWLLGIGGAGLAAWGLSQLPKLIGKVLDWLKKLFTIKIPDWFRWLFGPKGNKDIDLKLPEDFELPDADITTNIKKGDWSALDDLSGKPVYLSPKLDNKPQVLLENFKDDWNKVHGRTVYLSPKMDNSASVLYRLFKRAWDEIGSKILYFSPRMNNSAKVLYDNFKRDWDKAGSKVLYFTPKLDNKASVLWEQFKKDWIAARDTLYASPKLDNTATALWRLFKDEWDSLYPVVWIKVNYRMNPVSSLDDANSRSFGGGHTSGGGAGRGRHGSGIGGTSNSSSFDTKPIEEYVDKIKGKLSEIPASAQLNMMWFAKNLQQGEKDALNVTFQPVGENVAHSLTNGMNQTWYEATNAMNTNMGTLYNTADRVSFNDVGSGIDTDISSGVMQNTGYAVGTIAGLMSSLFSTADGKSFFNAGYNIVNTINSGVNSNKYWAQNTVSSLMNALYNSAGSLSFFNIGYHIASGIKQGIDSNWNWLTNTAWNLAVDIFNAAKSALGIASPSKVFEEGIGKNIDLGIAKGIDNSTPAALASISRMGEAVAEKFSAYDLQASISAMADYGTTFAPSYETSVQSDSGMSDNTNDRAMVDILRDVRRLLVEISAKDTTVEVTTSAINKAQTRMNRRAGVTIAPVGT